MRKQDLQPTEYNDYIGGYIAKVEDTTDLKTGYIADKNKIIDFFTSLPEDKLTYRYEATKWSVKEIFQHIIDTERVFIYRLFCIARNDTTNFPGYDQEIYIKPSGADAKTLDVLVDEFKTTRAYSIHILESLEDAALKNMGMVSDSPISARACAFLLLGHSIWHMDVIKNRYL